MTAVMERRRVRVVQQRLVSINEVLETLFVERANGFSQISIHRWVGQIYCFSFVFFQHPRENGILTQVVQRSPGEDVQGHKIIESAQFLSAPELLRAFGCFSFRTSVHQSRPRR